MVYIYVNLLFFGIRHIYKREKYIDFPLIFNRLGRLDQETSCVCNQNYIYKR